MGTQDPTHQPLVGDYAVAAETRFPSDDELIRGKSFFRGGFREDVREFCNRMETEVAEQNIPLPAEVILVLGHLKEKLDWDGLHALARYIEEDSRAVGASLQAYRRRCQYYLAAAGNPEAAGFIAQEAAILSLEDFTSTDDLRMIPAALSWAVTAHFIAGLSESALVETSVGSVEHLRRNVMRTFEKAMMSKALDSLPENEGALPESSPQVSDRDGFPRLESELAVRSNVLPFPVSRDPSQRRISLTVAELVAILKAANTAPESLSAALTAVGIPTSSPPTRPGSDK